MQDALESTVEFAGLEVESFGVDMAATKFDLTLLPAERPDGLWLTLQYRSDLYEPATAERFLGHVRQVLESAVADANRRVSALPLLADVERVALSVWNDTAIDFGALQPVHHRFEEAATRTPDAKALVAGDEQYSYADLDWRSNQMAHRLASLGVGSGSPVGIALERSADAIVALLAVLKAGGCYVPLATDAPAARIAQQLAESGASTVITHSAIADRLPPSVRTIRVDSDADLLAAEPSARPNVQVGGDDLAYILFTSGSTGVPKGVAVTHANIANYTSAIIRVLALDGAPLSYATVSTLAADLGNTAIFPALTSGGTLHVLPSDVTLDPGPRFAAYAAENPIDVLKITPSHLRAVMSAAGPAAGALLPRRWLVVGGEACPWELIDEVRRVGSCRILNHYGPTETTVGACTYEPKSRADAPLSATVPIGFPLANVQLHVLDGALQSLPVGVPGELFVGGAGVARGYLNRADLTSERFVDAGTIGRVYRTGDRVRRLPDGAIEFLGRGDGQVKIRGFRVELGEIEQVLTQFPGVDHAVAILHPDAADASLLAYIVPKTSGYAAAHAARPTPERLRDWISERLPDYMVPHAIVMLEKLPLNANGKLDRRALPVPGATDPAAVEIIAPRTPTEEALAGIWAEALKRDRVSIRDNFFELGGHSLIAIRVLGKVSHAPSASGCRSVPCSRPRRSSNWPSESTPRRRLRELSQLRAPFAQFPALRFAARIRGVNRDAGRDRCPAAVVCPGADVASRSTGVARKQRLQRAARAPASAGRCASTSCSGRSMLSLLRHEIPAHHVRIRAERPSGASPVLPPGPVAFEFIGPVAEYRRGARDAAISRELRERASRPFDLSQEPPLRVAVLRLDEQEHLVHMNSHHIAADGWSRDVIFRDLDALYTALASGKEPNLPALPIQYADFAAWQREQLSGSRLDELLGYWRAALGDAEYVLDLPTDFPRPPVAETDGVSTSIELPAPLVDAIRRLGRAHDATLYMTLLAGYTALLHRLTGRPDVLVGSPIAGRSVPETEGLIGYFANTIVQRGRFTDDPTFAGLLTQIRESALGAYEHQEVPFEKLVLELQDGQSLSHTPLFQVVFTMLEAAQESAGRLGDLSMEAVAGEGSTTKFDLTLFMAERGEALTLTLRARADLFAPVTVERLLARLQLLLEAVTSDPGVRVSQISLLTADEEALIRQANDTAVDLGPATTMTALIEDAIDRAPNATAVIAGAQRLTYAELESQANQLAARLRDAGVQPGGSVGLCIDRSADAIVAMLAILKCGAAYVPLAPEAPAARLAQQLAECDARVVVTRQHYLERLPAELSAICVDRDAGVIGEASVARHNVATSTDALAYVLFTSGSTGPPKGVAVTHANIVNYVRAISRVLGDIPADRAGDGLASLAGWTFGMGSSFAADLGNTALFPRSAPAGTLHLLDEATVTEPAQFAEYVKRQPIDVLKLTPNHVRALLGDRSVGELNAVLPRQWLVLGGEALTWELAERLTFAWV